nr:MAG TPA: hypothetical protein [Caudoviricetes sp.]
MNNFKFRMNLLEQALQTDNRKIIVQRSKDVLEAYKQVGVNFPNRSLYDESNLQTIEKYRKFKLLFKLLGFK